MGKLLCFELRKILRSKAFYACLAISLVFLLINVVTAKVIDDMMKELDPNYVGGVFSGVAFAKSGYSQASISLISSIFLAIYVSEDFTCGAIKNIIGKGFNRLSVFFSKYIVTLVTMFVWTGIACLLSFLLGTILYGNANLPNGNVALIILGQVLGVVALHAIYFVVSYSFGKLGLALTVNILGPMVIGLVTGLADAAIFTGEFKITNYWAESIMGNFSATVTNEKLILPGLILLVVYAGAAITIGTLLANKKEIK